MAQKTKHVLVKEVEPDLVGIPEAAKILGISASRLTKGWEALCDQCNIKAYRSASVRQSENGDFYITRGRMIKFDLRDVRKAARTYPIN